MAAQILPTGAFPQQLLIPILVTIWSISLTIRLFFFDITFCGFWAGNSYATSGCPGTCEEVLTDPSNFVNATWSINSLKIYRKQPFGGRVNSSLRSAAFNISPLAAVLLLGLFTTCFDIDPSMFL